MPALSIAGDVCVRYSAPTMRRIASVATSRLILPLSATDFDVPKDYQELKKPLDAAPPPVENPASSPSATP